MKRCAFCGKMADTGDIRCRYCGTVFSVSRQIRCLSCNEVFIVGSAFCSKCGAPAPKSCPSCKKTLKIGATFCVECGFLLPEGFWNASDLSQICQNCKNPLKPGVKFCTKCGTPVGQRSPSNTQESEKEHQLRLAKEKEEAERRAEIRRKQEEEIKIKQEREEENRKQQEALQKEKEAKAKAEKELLDKEKERQRKIQEKRDEKRKRRNHIIAIVLRIIGGLVLVAGIVAGLMYLLYTPEIEHYFNKDIAYGSFTDSRDNQKYRTIVIGNKEWFAQNLNYHSYGSYADDSSDIYGSLYTYESALSACPAGWTIPSAEDIEELFLSESPQQFISQKIDGTDNYGFSAITAGFYSEEDEIIKRRGEIAGFWLYENSNQMALRLKLDKSKENVDLDALDKNYGFSVRCIRDSQTSRKYPQNFVIDDRNGQIYKAISIGYQRWLDRNLSYPIRGSSCYDNADSNCTIYGRLYTFDAAQEVCPPDWRLPNKGDVDELMESNDFYNLMKLPLAGLKSEKNEYEGIDKYGVYWTLSGEPATKTYWYVTSDKKVYGTSKIDKNASLSVRCIEGNVQPDYSYAKFVDNRYNFSYNVVQIGDLFWTASNMYLAIPKEELPEYGYYDDDEETAQDVPPRKTYVEDEMVGYMQLYDWEIAKTACPDGFHLPSDKEWQVLKNHVIDYGRGMIGADLKDTTDGGFDTFGFSARLNGYYVYNAETISYGDERAYFWSATENGYANASAWMIDSNIENLTKVSMDKANALAVRCVRKI